MVFQGERRYIFDCYGVEIAVAYKQSQFVVKLHNEEATNIHGAGSKANFNLFKKRDQDILSNTLTQ
jgi:hypothetical protein